MARSLCVVGLILLVAAASSGVAGAQGRATTGDITGTATDPTGAVLPGVRIIVASQDTGLMREVMTGPGGRFTLPALPVGAYSLSTELQGFAPRKIDVALPLGAELDLRIELALAEVSQTITVRPEARLVDSQQTVVATSVSQRQIDSLPINVRNFFSFSLITPIVNIDRAPQQGATASSGLTFAGQRARSNNITVDGLDNNDVSLGSVRASFSQEAVREFQVLANSYSAEFGKASGGVVNIVTKSGTNRLSGNAFFYLRDDALNATEHFEKLYGREKAPYGQQQYGGIIGGPLKKDTLFYFFSFERLDIDTNNFVTIDDENLVSYLGQPLGTPAEILRRAGFPVETGNVPYEVWGDEFLGKADAQFSGNQNLAIRFNWADARDENAEPWGGLVAQSRGAYLESQDYMFAATHAAVLSASWVNEARFQFARRNQEVVSLDPNCNGPCTSMTAGGPTLEVIGVASVGRQRYTPQPRENDRYQFLDTATWYRGRQAIKLGVDFSYVDFRRQALPQHFGGRYIFSALPAIPGVLPAAASPIQAVALGLPAAYVQGYGNPYSSYGYKEISLFAQDDWRLSDRVTFKLGMRYQNQLWPDLAYDVPGVGAYNFPADNNNLAPRLALAWDPSGNGRTSVKASYGIFYDNQVAVLAGVTDMIDGTADGVRTLVMRFPSSVAAWKAPGRRIPESAAGPYPSLVASIDPGLKTPLAHHVSAGIEREISRDLSVSAGVVYARGFNAAGTIDYNPLVPSLGAGRRPLDVGGIPGTSASVLQFTSFGETWYRGVTFAVRKRFSGKSQFLSSYTLSKAEDTSTDYQSAFIPQNNGQGRNPEDPTGLPTGFEPNDERGPSLQDQRHRILASGLYVLPGAFHLSAIITVGSQRPFNILAGADLNGDGDGGSAPSDRARANPADIATSVQRNAGSLPWQATVDLRLSRRVALGQRWSIEGILDVFNLFNRTNFSEVNNIFGVGAYPSNPLPTYGAFQQAGPPRQVQFGMRVAF